jgi:UDP-glucose 4-epimerase
VVTGRRPGDAACCVASAELARKELGWSASRGLREMVASAWEGWCASRPEARRGDGRSGRS